MRRLLLLLLTAIAVTAPAYASHLDAPPGHVPPMALCAVIPDRCPPSTEEEHRLRLDDLLRKAERKSYERARVRLWQENNAAYWFDVRLCEAFGEYDPTWHRRLTSWDVRISLAISPPPTPSDEQIAECKIEARRAAEARRRKAEQLLEDLKPES